MFNRNPRFKGIIIARESIEDEPPIRIPNGFPTHGNYEDLPRSNTGRDKHKKAFLLNRRKAAKAKRDW